MADPAIIAELLLDRCEGMFAGDPVIPVAMPDVAFTPPADGKYIRVDLFSNVPFWQGLTSGKLDQGILQLTLVWPRDEGIVAPREVAGQIMSYWPKNLRLSSNGTSVKVNREPWAATPLVDASETNTPITIPWVAS